MPKKKAKSSSGQLPDDNLPFPVGTDAYFRFLENCISQDPDYDEGDLHQAGAEFSGHSYRIQQEINAFKNSSPQYSLMTVIFLWAQSISHDRVLGEKYLSMMEQLLVCHLIHHKHPIDRKPVDIAEFASWNPNSVVDRIRCYLDWSIEKREDFVKFYTEFSLWLSKQTFGLVSQAQDHDREITKQRKLSFETYINFLTKLDIRERIMTKIFYLGGAVGLEEVLSLEIKDIDFKAKTISISREPIKYPSHVFDDLKLFLHDRTEGFVFTGRNNDRINHTVPYRSLKAVAIKLGIPSSFTFKDFVKNQ